MTQTARDEILSAIEAFTDPINGFSKAIQRIGDAKERVEYDAILGKVIYPQDSGLGRLVRMRSGSAQ